MFNQPGPEDRCPSTAGGVGRLGHDDRCSRPSRIQRTTSSVPTAGRSARKASMRAAAWRRAAARDQSRIAALTARLRARRGSFSMTRHASSPIMMLTRRGMSTSALVPVRRARLITHRWLASGKPPREIRRLRAESFRSVTPGSPGGPAGASAPACARGVERGDIGSQPSGHQLAASPATPTPVEAAARSIRRRTPDRQACSATHVGGDSASRRSRAADSSPRASMFQAWSQRAAASPKRPKSPS